MIVAGIAFLWANTLVALMGKPGPAEKGRSGKTALMGVAMHLSATGLRNWFGALPHPSLVPSRGVYLPGLSCQWPQGPQTALCPGSRRRQPHRAAR